MCYLQDTLLRAKDTQTGSERVENDATCKWK